MTTVDPARTAPAASAADPAAPVPSGPARSLATVSVNLLPPEVVTARRARRARRATAVALAVLVLVLGALTFLARVDVGAARGELAAADGVSAGLRAQQGRYAQVVTLQDQARTAASQLEQLTTGGPDWAPLLTAVLAAAPPGVAVAPTAAAPDTGVPPVVALTLTGTATDPTLVAAYADALAGVPGLVNVAVTSVTAGQEGAYAFSVSAAVPTDASATAGAPAAPGAAAVPAPTATGGR